MLVAQDVILRYFRWQQHQRFSHLKGLLPQNGLL